MQVLDHSRCPSGVSDDRNVCENYDATTADDLSEEDEVVKREQERKVFSNYITGIYYTCYHITY